MGGLGPAPRAEDRAEGRDAAVGAERASLGPPSPRERSDQEVSALGERGCEGTGGKKQLCRVAGSLLQGAGPEGGSKSSFEIWSPVKPVSLFL